MPRDGSNVYALPSGSTFTAGTTIESAKVNAALSDLATDLNTARPIVAGGTGATTAATAATALGLGTGDSPQFTAVNVGHASDTTLARASAGNLSVEGNLIYRAGGTDVPLADGGTGASLADPNTDRIMFWDDSAGGVTWLAPGTGLSISGTTLIGFANELTELSAAASVGTGTTYSVTGLSTSYKGFLVVFSGVSHNSGSNQTFRVAVSSNNGSAYGSAMVLTGVRSGAQASDFIARIHNTGNNGAAKRAESTDGLFASDAVTTGLIDALQFSPSGGNFDAGTIAVYGWN